MSTNWIAVAMMFGALAFTTMAWGFDSSGIVSMGFKAVSFMCAIACVLTWRKAIQLEKAELDSQHKQSQELSSTMKTFRESNSKMIETLQGILNELRRDKDGRNRKSG